MAIIRLLLRLNGRTRLMTRPIMQTTGKYRIKNLYKELKEGKHGVIKPFEPYVPSTEYLELEARGKRDGLLQELDAVVSNPMRWEDLSKVQKGELRDYRTLLLDVPQQLTFPETIHWPTKPTYL